MQFLLLIYDQEKRTTALSEAEQAADYQEFAAFGNEFAAAIKGGKRIAAHADC